MTGLSAPRRDLPFYFVLGPAVMAFAVAALFQFHSWPTVPRTGQAEALGWIPTAIFLDLGALGAALSSQNGCPSAPPLRDRVQWSRVFGWGLRSRTRLWRGGHGGDLRPDPVGRASFGDRPGQRFHLGERSAAMVDLPLSARSHRAGGRLQADCHRHPRLAGRVAAVQRQVQRPRVLDLRGSGGSDRTAGKGDPFAKTALRRDGRVGYRHEPGGDRLRNSVRLDASPVWLAGADPDAVRLLSGGQGVRRIPLSACGRDVSGAALGVSVSA